MMSSDQRSPNCSSETETGQPDRRFGACSSVTKAAYHFTCSLLDVAAFAELLHRVSAMVEDIPEIAELDLNPVFVRQHGAVVADIRVRLTR